MSEYTPNVYENSYHKALAKLLEGLARPYTFMPKPAPDNVARLDLPKCKVVYQK